MAAMVSPASSFPGEPNLPGRAPVAGRDPFPAEGAVYANRYRLIRPLGRGGLGEVWLAFDNELRLDVALKFIKESLGPGHVELLRHEVRQARALSHRYILRVHDFVFPEGEPAAISMEFAAGGTVANFLTKERSYLDFELIEEWIFETCEALAYLHHDCQMVHRDIKPANLMLDASGRIKLADFNLSVTPALAISDASREAMGTRVTLHFASPQVIADPADSDPRNDLYALGVTIFVLLSGTYPFPDPLTGRWQWDPENLLSINQRRGLKGCEGGPVPQAWDHAVARCLAEDPDDRPRSAVELLELLGGPPPQVMGAAVRVRTIPRYVPVDLPPVVPPRGRPMKIAMGVAWTLVVAGAMGLLLGMLVALGSIWKARQGADGNEAAPSPPEPALGAGAYPSRDVANPGLVATIEEGTT